MIWSKYQTAFFKAIKDNEALHREGKLRRNLQVGAVAGSGKSTCCLEGIRIAVAEMATVLYSMFTKDTTEEFRQKIINAGLGDRVRVETAHALGFAAIRRVRRKVKVEGRKVANIVEEWTNTLEEDDPQAAYAGGIEKLVKFAKDRGIGIFCKIDDRSQWQAIIDHHGMSFGEEISFDDEGDDDTNEDTISFIIDKSIEFLKRSNAIQDVIDFSDMIYQALLFNCPFEQFDYVFVDESQDTNPVRRELFRRCIGFGGCLVDVGDECQAIMGFTGADNDAMKIIRDEFHSLELPLSICYRCDRAIIEHAQKWVSHIECSPTAGEGEVSSMKYEDFIKEPEKLGLSKFDAILCRKNAPLAATAFSLIRKGIGCRIEGRDIGYSLVALVNRWKVRNLPELRRKLDDFREREVEKAQQKNQAAKIETINDKCDTLMCLIERAEQVAPTIEGLKKIIYDMFSDAKDPKTRKDLLVLSSVHKSKGREWDRVFLLGRQDYMPSPWAKQQWEKDQENHLIYVAITRAKHTLVEVTHMPDERKDKKQNA
jgi:superfamily I DNA/RNA helicase